MSCPVVLKTTVKQYRLIPQHWKWFVIEVVSLQMSFKYLTFSSFILVAPCSETA